MDREHLKIERLQRFEALELIEKSRLGRTPQTLTHLCCCLLATPCDFCTLRRTLQNRKNKKADLQALGQKQLISVSHKKERTPSERNPTLFLRLELASLPSY
ncbi:Hypothetical protein PSEBR_m1736 [Pseudomonas brassicacearum subsp. brassicacearum NFM421]|uniref:Uncharacterized protein n=1 Tax=Pseudomonas brassicacearum (strain NFM421) TaxID=994484 RepID=F2K730_PSEBN|nr:Hypothetical protein PSEBR_m1736 [Pseudomonas brassicacearum subsp. brassicacearum NFM421]